jgi:hypothetical protein
VFTAQTEGNFAGYPAEHQIGGVNNKPLVHHVSGFCAESFHGSMFRVKNELFSTVGVSLLETS